MKRILLIIFCIYMVLIAQIQAGQPQNSIESKMSGMLVKKFRAFKADTSVTTINKMEYGQRYGSKFFPVDNQGRMFLCVTVAGNVDSVANGIISLGGIIHNQGKISINAWIPIDKLADVSALNGAAFIDGAGYAVSRTGAVSDTADHQLLADSARSVFYTNGATVSGTPVSVGVISSGIGYYTASQQSGDLPASISLVSSGGYDSRHYVGSEGTAMMEIVHDLAPGASLTFGGVGKDSVENYTSAPLDMANVINTMSSSAGCKVIVDDIGWLNGEPWFSDGDVASAIYSFQQQQTGNVYVSAAGNDGQYMYAGKPSISSTGSKNWAKFSGADTSLTFTINGYSEVFIGLQWDDAWGSASTDYNLYIYDSNWNLFDSSATQGGVLPQEWVDYTAGGGAFNNATFHIMVEYRNYILGLEKNIKVLVSPNNVLSSPFSFSLNYKTSTGQIYGHTAATNCISVAAYDAKSGSVESFSSRGPSLMFTSGNPANEQSRNTPVITATDDVETYVGQKGHFEDPFYGTSGAAPHVAAIAALYYSRYPSNTASQLISAIKSTGKSISGGTGGTWNSTSGSGKISAYDAIVYSLTTLSSPHVTSNTSWDLDHVTGTATIDAGKTVTIDANYTAQIDGTVNFGDNNSKILVYGTLILGNSAMLNPASGLVFELGGRIIGGNFYTVTAKQLDGSSNSFGYVGHWNFAKFDSGLVPYTFPSVAGTSERMRGQQYFESGTTQKFQLWNINNARVINPDTFKTTAGQPNIITAHFLNANNATLQSQLLEGGSPSGTLSLLDPWMIDTADSYGLRNNGMADWYRPVSYSLNNLGTGSAHQGVFLGQDPANTPTYLSVSAPATQLIGSYTGIFQNWSATGAHFSNANLGQTAVIFDAAGAMVSANYKGIHLSSNAATWQNNSQRKFVRTNDGSLHSVYESGGHVWYEISTNNGSTWTIANNSKPLDVYGGKLPAIDCQVNDVAIVWEENWLGSGAAGLRIARFQVGYIGTNYPLDAFVDPTTSYSQNLDPVIAYDFTESAVVAWENKDNYIYPVGIAFEHGPLIRLSIPTYTWAIDYHTVISATDINCVYPTISVAKNPTDQYNMVYNVAWESIQSSSNSSVNYCKATALGNSVSLSAVSSPSSGAGFWQDEIPSIVSMNDNTARLVWWGYAPWYGNRVVYRSTNPDGTWSSTVVNMGSNVIQPCINTTNDGKFVIGWVQNNVSLSNDCVTSDNLYGLNSLTPIGNNLQLNNAVSLSTMYSMPFQNQIAPYSFGALSNLGSIHKTSDQAIGRGRAVVSVVNGRQYLVGLGDIIADNVNVGFVSLDSLPMSLGKGALGNFLQTQDFAVNNNSKITCSLFHGMIDPTDSTDIVNSLGIKENIGIKVAILDAQTNQLLSAIGNYNVANGEKDSTTIASYSINLSGIGQRTIRLAFVFDDNVQAEYVINEFFTNGKSVNLAKSMKEEISLSDAEKVTDYALNQNYPNPFNPATTISYQIPKDGQVTIKIFDALGREVRTLIDEFKASGQYTVKFDASHLSSGIYFYSIRSGDYNAVKKMSLIK